MQIHKEFSVNKYNKNITIHNVKLSGKTMSSQHHNEFKLPLLERNIHTNLHIKMNKTYT